MLDRETMGLYFIALMVTFLLKLLSDLGVDLAFVKQYPEETDQGKSNLLRTVFFIRLLSCTVVTLLYKTVEASGAISFINLISDFTFLTLALFWMHSFRELLLRLLQATQQFNIYAGTQVLAATLKALLVLGLLLLSNVGVKHVLVIETIAFLASILFAAYRIKDTLLAALNAKLGGGKAIIQFGYPLYLNALLNLGNERVSQYIVAGFGGPLSMAFFGIAERLADAGSRLFESFVNVYYPTQTRYFAEKNTDQAKQFANRSMMWIAFIITSGIVSFTILREPVILIFFTEKYLSVTNAAAMFFGVLLLRLMQTLMGYFGVAAGEKFLPVKVSLVSSVVNVALCYLLFKIYGYQGAIAALVLTQLLMNVLYFVWLRKSGYELHIKPIVILCTLCVAAITVVYLLTEHFALSTLVLPAFILACMALLPGLRNDTTKALTKVCTTITSRMQAKNIRNA